MAKRKRKPSKKAKKQFIKPIPKRKPTLDFTPPPNIPVYDYLADKDLDDLVDIEQLLEDLALDLEMGYFLQWEAVLRREQKLPLSTRHAEILEELEDGQASPQIRYINELPRPTQPWYKIVEQIVPKLVVDELDLNDDYFMLYTQGWAKLVIALNEQAKDLSQPPETTNWLTIIPEKTRHRLWVQYCFSQFAGLGSAEALTLHNEEQHTRIDWFMQCIEQHKASLAYFNLTIETLLDNINLPPDDRAVLVEAVVNQLELDSSDQRL